MVSNYPFTRASRYFSNYDLAFDFVRRTRFLIDFGGYLISFTLNKCRTREIIFCSLSKRLAEVCNAC